MRRLFPHHHSGLALGLGLALIGARTAWAQAPQPAAAPTPSSAAAPPSIFDEEPTTVAAHPIPDGLESFNRDIFKFNDGLYQVVLRPVAQGWEFIVPLPAERGIGRFFHNIAFPTRFVGNVLEGKFKDAGIETERFVINSVTSLGFAATADKIPGLQERPSDLGLAFGSWGIGHGSYLVLPLLGPSSIRDGIGFGLSSYFLDPVQYVNGWKYRLGIDGLLYVNATPDLLRSYDQLKAAAVDPYVALRDAYAAQRVHRVSNETGSPTAPAVSTNSTPTK